MLLSLVTSGSILMPPGSRSNRRDQAAGRPLPVHRQVKGENIFQESILGTFWPPAIFVLRYFSRLSNSYSSLPGGRNDNHPLRTAWKPAVPISYPDPLEVGSFVQFEDYGH